MSRNLTFLWDILHILPLGFNAYYHQMIIIVLWACNGVHEDCNICDDMTIFTDGCISHFHIKFYVAAIIPRTCISPHCQEPLIKCECWICAERQSENGWQVIWFPDQLFDGYAQYQCHSTSYILHTGCCSTTYLVDVAPVPGCQCQLFARSRVCQGARVTCGCDQCRKWCHDHYCPTGHTSANYCKLLLCQTTTSALENHCILYWAIYLLHCHIYIAVLNCIPREQWYANFSPPEVPICVTWVWIGQPALIEGYSSQICLPSDPLHLRPQSPKLTNFHFLKYSVNKT